MPYSPNPISNPVSSVSPLHTHLPPPSLWASGRVPFGPSFASRPYLFVPQPPILSPCCVSALLCLRFPLCSQPTGYAASSPCCLFAFSWQPHPLSLGLPPPQRPCLHLHLRLLGPTSSHAGHLLANHPPTTATAFCHLSLWPILLQGWLQAVCEGGVEPDPKASPLRKHSRAKVGLWRVVGATPGGLPCQEN